MRGKPPTLGGNWGLNRPLLTPQDREKIRERAKELREEEPGISARQISFRLAGEFPVSASTIRTQL